MRKWPDISVLIPSRGRPQKLSRCLDSLGLHRNVEILVATDDDDASDYASAVKGPARLLTAPRAKTLGICVNALADKAAGNLLFFLGDDHVIDVPDWPNRILRAAAKMPNGVGVLYPRCRLHPRFATLPIISRRMYEHLGYYMAPHFPFWFIDTWWDEIGELLGAKIEIDLDVALPDGKGDTHGLTDIYFWADFFDATRALRVRHAVTLAKLAHGERDPRFRSFMTRLPRRQCECAEMVAHHRTPAFIRRWEKRSDAAPSKRYAEAKSQAETLMDELRKEPREDLRWETGTLPPVPRNGFCPCGSGRRYKHCHGALLPTHTAIF